MTERSVAHSGFTIERSYDAAPARVFEAFADPAIKVRWACHEDWKNIEMDFRVGGRELNRGGEPGGPVYTVDARYHDIVAGERIVFSYVMYHDETRVSASLSTIEFRPEGAGTRLTFTEHGAFLDGHDAPAGREQGSGVGLDKLAEFLRRESVAA